jgi:hypothetical protein
VVLDLLIRKQEQDSSVELKGSETCHRIRNEPDGIALLMSSCLVAKDEKRGVLGFSGSVGRPVHEE